MRYSIFEIKKSELISKAEGNLAFDNAEKVPKDLSQFFIHQNKLEDGSQRGYIGLYFYERDFKFISFTQKKNGDFNINMP